MRTLTIETSGFALHRITVSTGWHITEHKNKITGATSFLPCRRGETATRGAFTTEATARRYIEGEAA